MFEPPASAECLNFADVHYGTRSVTTVPGDPY